MPLIMMAAMPLDCGISVFWPSESAFFEGRITSSLDILGQKW
jgi:hypothetical protein